MFKYDWIAKITYKPKFFVSTTGFLVLLVSVYLTSGFQFLPDVDTAGEQLLPCEVAPLMTKNIDDTAGLNPENISFLNWNIYKGNGDRWQQDLSGFAENHDVMTIQEAVLDKALTGLLDEHDMNWEMSPAFRLKGAAAGVMTAATSDAVHSCGFKVSEPLIRVPKAALISYYAIIGSNENLLVANIHAINFTPGVTAYRQQLQQLYEAIVHHNGPMIVAGDFNSWSQQRMEQMHLLTKKLALSEIEYSVNNKTHIFGNAIDHVFYRKLELVSNHVWQVSSSDHNPISVKFRFHSSVL